MIWLVLAGLGGGGCSDDSRPSPPAPDSWLAGEAEGEKARAIWTSCALCHGTREMQRGPILDGLPVYYTESQLGKFQAGLRGRNLENRAESLMGSAISQLIAPSDHHSVAVHLASLPRQVHPLTVRGDADRGRILFEICRACHREEAQGDPVLKSAPLHLMEDWYLLQQLRAFKAGRRGYHPDDTEGRTMQQVVQPLGDADFRDVVHYIASQLAKNEADDRPQVD